MKGAMPLLLACRVRVRRVPDRRQPRTAQLASRRITPGNTAGPVLPHRPSKTPPVLRNHREGQVTMLNVTNPVGKDKSRWPKDNLRCPKGNTAETIRVPDLYLASTTWGRCDRPASVADMVGGASTLAAAWLIGLPRRAGRRLFAMNDAEG